MEYQVIFALKINKDDINLPSAIVGVSTLKVIIIMIYHSDCI